MKSDYFAVHAHSEFSTLDGMGSVEDMVAKADMMGQPALALTDHGTMAGCIRLYKECRKVGIEPFPGIEAYVVRDVTHEQWRKQRYHLGLLALDYIGYKTLVGLSSLSHQRERFHRKPLIDFSDLSFLHEEGLSKHIAITTGCYFGLVVQRMLDEGDINGGLNMVRMLATWFPHTFIEVQNHGIKHDDTGLTSISDEDITDALLSMADMCGLPVVAGQDSHYLVPDHKPVHDLMKDICYFGDGEDNRFPGDSFHMAHHRWMRKRFPDCWDRIEEGHGHLLDLNKMTMPALDNYKFRVPQVGRPKFVDHDLKQECLGEGVRRGLDTPEYDERVMYELKVIAKMGMADYFLLVKEVTDWCRENGVIVNARGSANGSLVCYLLGITNVDPIQWNTSFDRFLSLDRKKPPDIDLDVEPGGRAAVIDHLRKKFPTLVQIGTYLNIGFTSKKDDEGEGEDKGSVFVQYMAAMRKKDPTFNGSVKPEHRDALEALGAMHVRKSAGAHAAGFVLPGQGQEIADYLPTMLIPSSGNTVTQMVMEDIEEAGYVKLDVLGVRTLNTISNCMEAIGKDPNDFSWIPWDDPKTCLLLRSGAGAGIFQFDGYSTMKGGRQMKIRSTHDAILCLALYRPAMMASGMTDQYLENRRKGAQSKTCHRFFDAILRDTCSIPVFQEQVMEMCRSLGMAYEDWNDLMKAVKASNDKIGQYAVDIFKRVRPIFVKLCIGKGLTKQEADQTWQMVVGFTDYGFNRAHATSYGLMAYRSAYLKAHYPLEYMAALLGVWAGTNKEPVYRDEARRMGIDIGRPDVNKSGVTWAIDPKRPKTLRKGLLSVKGLGQKAAESIVEHRPADGWKTMDDFIDAVPARPVSGGKQWKKDGTLNGVMHTLKMAGALTSLGVNPDD